MPTSKRAKIHEALKGEANAVRRNRAEDEEDLAAYEARRKEPVLDLEKVLKDLRHRGKV